MAVICKAIDVIKDNKGVTAGYVLADINGNVMQVSSDKIKAAIKAKQVIVSNLKVTSNNRLIKEDIEVSKKFITIANKISEISGVKHTKSRIEDFYFYTKFENTPVFLLGQLDDSKVTFFVKDKNVEGTLNANTLPKAAALVKQMYCDYVNANTTVNPDMAKPKDDKPEQQHRIITIDSSKIYFNQSKIAEELGIDWIQDDKAFRIVDENAIVVVNLDYGADVTFLDSKVHGFKVTSDNCRYGILFKYCEMQYLDVKNTNAQMMGCIIYNQCNIFNGTPRCYSLTYINNLKTEDYKNIDLDNIIGNNVHIHGVNLAIDCSDCVQYINNLFVTAENNLQVIGNSWTVKNIEFTGETVRFEVNQYKKDTEKKMQRELANMNGNYTYHNLYMIVCNHFLGADSVEPLIKVNGAIKLVSLIWRCKFADEIKVKASDDYSRMYNAEIIQDTIPDLIKIGAGGIAITNNTNITFFDLKIANLYKSKYKNYILGDSGIFLVDDLVKNFSITIENSIKPATKSSTYDLNLVIKELKKISEINPIKVYYGTQAYEILTTNGVKVDILNKDAIGQKIKNTAAKEKIIGITVMDTIERAVSKSLNNSNDSARYSIDTGINVELPDKIIETYNLSIASGSNIDISPGIKYMLDLLMLFPANNLPFTTDVLNKITSDAKFRVHTELVATNENIMVNLISITYTGMSEIDQYIVVTNGKNLIYMTYIGDCEFKYHKGSSSNIQEGVHAVSRLDAVDLVLKSVRQNLTISSVKDTKQFITNVYELFNLTTLLMLNPKTSSIITVGDSGDIVTFKVGYKKLKKTKFDINYERQYLHEIERLEPNNNINAIKDNVAESYKNSILLNTKDIETVVNSESNTISICKVSKLWQIAHKHINSDCRDIITADLLNDLLHLEFFNIITQDEFVKALKKTSEVYKKYKTDGSFEIQTYIFNGKLKKLQSKYMGKIEYLYVITYFDGSAEYYSADESIDTVLSYMKKIAFAKEYDTFESYSNDFYRLKQAYGYYLLDADKLAYSMAMAYKEIKYKNVPGYKLYYAIKDAEKNHDYDRKLHILKLMGMSEYEYTTMIERGLHSSEDSKGDNITSEVIAKMPKSQELIDILGISEDIFDELCTLNMCDEMTYKLKHLIHQSIVTIYSSKNRLQSTYKNYSTRVCIGVCKMTGYCYLFTNNGGYMLPTLRLPSFRDAMLLRRQLIEEESLIQKKHGLLQDLGWIHSQDLMQTIELNLQGVKETSKYPQKYRYVVAYIPKEKEFEELDGETTVNNSTDNKVLNEYNQSHLMQFIKMGAVQLVASIPTSYKYSNTYSLNGVGYKAVEYYNKDSNIYAFKIGKDIIAISEYSLEELFS